MGARKSSALLRAEAPCRGCRSGEAATGVPHARVAVALAALLHETPVLCVVSCFCAQERAASTGSPYGAAGSGRKGPQGRREGSRRFRCQHTDVLSAEPGRCLRTRRAGARRAHRPGCPFSWLLLFGQAKRSDSPAGMRAKPRRTRVGFTTTHKERTPSPPNLNPCARAESSPSASCHSHSPPGLRLPPGNRAPRPTTARRRP